MHVIGAVWAFDRDEARGKRAFLIALIALTALALVGGGASWIWLMTR